jgi:hypothetical protein
MVFIAFLTMDWDCGLRRIQKKVKKKKKYDSGHDEALSVRKRA